MPTYDFKCSECGVTAEVFQKMSAPSTITCPKCNKPSFEKQMSAPNFHLKGGGYYKTDFKNNSNAHSCSGKCKHD